VPRLLATVGLPGPPPASPACSAAYACGGQGRGYGDLAPGLMLLVVQVSAALAGSRAGLGGSLSYPGFGVGGRRDVGVF
jgi:hypothetical protein